MVSLLMMKQFCFIKLIKLKKMKKNLIGILSLSAIVLLSQSCKKELSADVMATAPAEEAIVIYIAPDTANAQPGHYFVTFKESFKKPFAQVFNGDKTVRGARQSAADTYGREAQTAILGQLRNADGSMIVSQQSISAFVSNVVVGFDAVLTTDAVKKLVANPNVKYVEFQTEEFTDEDVTSTTASTFAPPPPPPGQTVDALRQQIGFKNGYQQSLTNTIWIIDGGCDMDHPDLRVYTPWARCFSDANTVEDSTGHGTKVAGVLAAIDNGFGTRGVAAGAYIVPIRIKNKDESASASNFVKALDYVWINSITNDVVNLSQGFSAKTTGIAAMEDAIKNYAGYDTWFALSAGNNRGYASLRSPARMSSPNYPYAETLKFITCVSSYGSAYKFSAVFPGGDPKSGSNYGVAVDYASAGVNIYSTYLNGGYTPYPVHGTSYATPIVAGILFLNKGVIYYNKKYVTGDVDGNPDKVAALNYQF